MPNVHEEQALSLHLYKKAEKYGQKVAEHARRDMKKKYQKDHVAVVWPESIQDLDISPF
ncbi:Integrase [Pseudomonas caricapapayae]|uniref:Integrase n=1 Tax=Pseudomonas caricapapayae TaxID=46678 RepID=A0A3M6FAS8_9PSED|nr:hypothetical protein [Pseudomonas caricapapayae]RMV77438.1 Integrase [Pseudomonas caricapapayae]